MDESQIARRTQPRYELEQGLHGQTRFSAPVQLLDLSTTGALLEYHQYLKPGEELLLQLQLGGSRYKIRCTVIHSSLHEVHRPSENHLERPIYRVGVRFLDLSSSGHNAIQELIRERLENDRREQPRLFIGRTANLQQDIEIRTVNLGRAGGLFTVPHPLDPGTEYDFVFYLPKGEVRVRGVVRHCQSWSHSDEASFQIGVEFTRFAGNGVEIIIAYLADLERKSIRL